MTKSTDAVRAEMGPVCPSLPLSITAPEQKPDSVMILPHPRPPFCRRSLQIPHLVRIALDLSAHDGTCVRCNAVCAPDRHHQYSLAKAISPAPIDRDLPLGTGFPGPGYQNHLPAGHKQNKASVPGRTLKVPTIVLTAGLAT
ncbi:MAG: hypothetical protein ABIL01_28310 [Pseudomonadota bacterium]